MQDQAIRLGLRSNMTQFVLLAVNNAFVGTMVGIERTVVPMLGQRTFHLSSLAVLLAFIASFGLVKGPINLVAGRLADRWGRKPILIAGWVFGLPVPLMMIWAPSWAWIVVANLLLGVNQGFAWSMTVTSKMDLVGPKRRGLALGINEFSGYMGVAVISTIAGYLAFAYSPRPIPFIVSEIFAVIGLITALVFIRETLPFTKLEMSPQASNEATLSLRHVFTLVSFKNRTLFACSQAGLINKLSDTAIWGLVPIQMARDHFTVAQIGEIGGIYAFTWGVLQLASGIWSDHVGRKLPIVLGQILSAAGIGLVLVAQSLVMWIIVALLMGIGTALLYPVLLSAVGDASNPAWRGTALGVYRMWRDGGYAIGGILLGFGADWLGIHGIFVVLAMVVFMSGVIVMIWMSETLTVADSVADSSEN